MASEESMDRTSGVCANRYCLPQLCPVQSLHPPVTLSEFHYTWKSTLIAGYIPLTFSSSDNSNFSIVADLIVTFSIICK